VHCKKKKIGVVLTEVILRRFFILIAQSELVSKSGSARSANRIVGYLWHAGFRDIGDTTTAQYFPNLEGGSPTAFLSIESLIIYLECPKAGNHIGL
jgi:hypothetical protein